jgi:hypothetical protein
MFRALTCPSSGGQVVLSQHLVSSHSVNGCTVCRMRADFAECSRLERVTIPDAVIIQFVLLKMDILMSKHVEDCNVTYILLMNKRIVH